MSKNRSQNKNKDKKLRTEDLQRLRKLFRESESTVVANEPMNPSPWGRTPGPSDVQSKGESDLVTPAEFGHEKMRVKPVEDKGGTHSSEDGFLLSSRRVSKQVPATLTDRSPEIPTVAATDIREASGVVSLKNRRNARRHGLWKPVLAALVVQMTVIAGAAAVLWHGGGREWLRHQLINGDVETQVEASSSVTEHYLSIFSNLTDNALLTDDRTYLDELRNLYAAEGLDEKLVLFAKNKEGLLLATYRDRVRTHRLLVKDVLPLAEKKDESQLGVSDLVSILDNKRIEPIDRARAAYLLGMIGDRAIAPLLVEVVETGKNLHVVIASYHAFCSMTGYQSPSGLDASAIWKWWNENGAKILANHSD